MVRFLYNNLQHLSALKSAWLAVKNEGEVNIAKESEKYKNTFDVEFSWYYPSSGFKWDDPFSAFKCDGPNDSNYYLTEIDNNKKHIDWEPFNKNHTFANFAELKTSGDIFDDAFIEWANNHGRLTKGEYLNVEEHIFFDGAYDFWMQNLVEPQKLWYGFHKKISHLFKLWKWAEESNETELAMFFGWQQEGEKPTGFLYWHDGDKTKNMEKYIQSIPPLKKTISPSGASIIFSEESHAWKAVAKSYPNLSALTREYVKKQVLAELENCQIRFGEYTQQIKGEKQRIVVPDLRAAMWLQFHFYINKLIVLKRCTECGLWEAMGGNHRPSRWTTHEECLPEKRKRENRKDS